MTYWIKNKTGWGYLSLGILVFPQWSFAESSLLVRPQAGYGYSKSSETGVSHAGVRLLLQAGGTKRYGLELTRLRMNDKKIFTALGVVLEQKRWASWFNTSIATVGYFGYGDESENPVGLMTSLGWEPDHYKKFKPFVTFRNDLIFSKKTETIQSLSIGMALEY